MSDIILFANLVLVFIERNCIFRREKKKRKVGTSQYHSTLFNPHLRKDDLHKFHIEDRHPVAATTTTSTTTTAITTTTTTSRVQISLKKRISWITPWQTWVVNKSHPSSESTFGFDLSLKHARFDAHGSPRRSRRDPVTDDVRFCRSESVVLNIFWLKHFSVQFLLDFFMFAIFFS